ncbi:hypothetical protein D3C81_1299480 [compost metagenome]
MGSALNDFLQNAFDGKHIETDTNTGIGGSEIPQNMVNQQIDEPLAGNDTDFTLP